MNSEKRLLIAIALSALVILVYQSYVSKYYKHSGPAVDQQEQMAQPPEPLMVDRQVAEMVRAGDEEISKAQGRRENFINGLYEITTSDIAAGIEEMSLLGYKDGEGKQQGLITSKQGYPDALMIEDITPGRRSARWATVDKRESEIIYRQQSSEKTVTKTVTFYNNNYIIGLEVAIRNEEETPQEIQYKVIAATETMDKGQLDNRYIGAEAQLSGKINRRKPGQKSIQEAEIFNGNPDWVMLKSRYFSYILIAEQPAAAAFIEGVGKQGITAGIVIGPVMLDPKEERRYRFKLYAGPMIMDNIAKFDPAAKTTINYGLFTPISKLMLSGLSLLNRIFHNYGVAIILMSCAISLMLSPLSSKSMKSMKEMQKIQPEVEQIRNEYKENPQKMHKEIMELYKKHKVNPMGGCLPMFFQIPVFLSLYQALIRNVALKGATFLWIRDLSEADRAFKLSTKLPVIGEYINVLPILMMIAMFFQQKLTQPQSSASEQQKMMSTIFPLMIGFIFYSLPSGLILYWLTNTVIMVVMQKVATRSS